MLDSIDRDVPHSSGKKKSQRGGLHLMLPKVQHLVATPGMQYQECVHAKDIHQPIHEPI